MASVLSRIQIIMEANTARYNNELRRARENSSTSFAQIGKSASKAALVVGTALVAMGAASVKTAMSFETAMAEVNKTADFVTEDGLGNLRKELEDLSKVMPLAFEELADIAASGGQMGIAGENLAQFTETIAKMGIAFDISAGQAAESMGFIASAYQVPIEKLGEVGDAINEVSNNSGATADKTIDFMLRTGAAANNMHIAAEATAAMGAAIIDAGGSVEKSGTAVSGMLLDMANPEWLKDNANLFKEMGVSTTEFAKLVKTDGLAAFNLFRDGIIATDDPMTALRDSFGAAAPHVQKLFDETSRFVPLLDAVGQGAEGAATHIGSLDNEYRVMADTTANAFVLIQNSARLVADAFGAALLPAVREITDALIPMIQKVAEWTKANPELIKQIFIVGGALSGTVLGLKLAVDGFTAAKTTIDGLKLAYAALGTTMGLTVLGLGILLAAGVLVYQNWDEIKRVVSENQPAFIALGVSVSALTVALIAANAPLILLKVQAAAAAVQAGVMAVATAGWSVAAGVAAAATWTFNAALAVLTSPILLVVAAIALIAAGGYLVVKNWAAISAGLNAEFNKIKSYVLNTVASMQAAWDRGVANTRGAIINIKNTIVTTLKELPSRMLQIGKDIVNGLINGIKQGASGVATAIGSMASSAVAKAKSVLDIRSPSRVMKTVGEQTAQGMADGIKKGKKAVVTEAQKMAAEAVKAVQDGVASLKREIALFGNDSPIAALKYDISIGKFGGADTSQLMSLTQTKEQLELTKKLADANNSVQDSIDGLIKQQALFGNNSSLAALMYDIEHTEKYKSVTQELTDKLVEQTRALEQLGMTAKATAAIQERFAQLEKDRESSRKAVDGVMNELVNESPMAKIQADYARRMDIIKTNEMLETGIIGSAAAERLAIEQSYQDAKRNLMLTQGESLFGDLAGMAKSFAGEQSGIYRALFAVEKGFAIAQSAIAIQQSVAKAMALGFPQNIPVIAQTIGMGVSLLGNIKSIAMPVGQAHDGIANVPREGTWVLDKNERVVKADDNKKLSRFLDGNDKKGAGVNITINNNSSASVSAKRNADGTVTIEMVDKMIEKSFRRIRNSNSIESKSIQRGTTARPNRS